MSENYVSTMMMLRSSFRYSIPLTTAAATVAAVASPPPLPLSLLPSTLSNTRFLLEDSMISNDNDDDDDDDDDGLSYYDLYESPCRTLIRASNDELDEAIIISNEENIISYNSNQMINSGAKLLFDEMEYCGTTFFGGCQYNNLTELITQINNNDNVDIENEEEQDINSIPSHHSFVNWTVFFDYEIHYIDVSNNERSHHSNDVNEDNDALVIINEQRTNITATSAASSRTKMKTSEMLRQPQRRRKEQQQQQDQYTYHRGDPIPAVEYLETIVLEHLSEVVGLTRRDCDDGISSSSSSSSSNSSSNTTEGYHHDFNDNELDRMMAISSDPVDLLDPDYGKCIVPVSSVINQQSDCIPVRGAIRVYLNTTGVIIDNDDNDNNSTMAALKLSIESGFKRLIRFGMQRDLYISVVGDDDDDEAGTNDSRTDKNEVIVKQVSFIGTRIVSDNNDDEDNGTLVARGVDDDDEGEKDNEETTENKNGDTPTTATAKYDDGYNDYNGELSSLNLSDSTTVSSNDTTHVTGLVLGSVGLVIFAFLVAMLCSTPRKQNSNNDNTTEVVN
jgi:hypothetical protein